MKKDFAWNPEKSEELKLKRGFGFEDIIASIESNVVLDNVEHASPKYPNQQIMYVGLNDYVIAVPYVMDGETRFLKTAFPNRRATKKYLNR